VIATRTDDRFAHVWRATAPGRFATAECNASRWIADTASDLLPLVAP